MALLNKPIGPEVTLAPSIFEQAEQKKQSQELAQLQLANIRSQIGLRGAQTQQALSPKTESGSSELARMKAGLLQVFLDPNTPPEIRDRIKNSGVFGGASQTVNIGGEPQKSAKDDLEIAKAFQTTADVQNALNPDATTEVVVETGTRGQRFLATKPKPAPSAKERTDLADALASEDALNNLGTLFDEKFVGPVKGRVGTVLNALAFTETEQAQFLAATAALKNAVVKQITGAQMSEPEARRIFKQIPLPSDGPIQWQAKKKQSLKNISFMKKRRIELLRKTGARVPDVGKPKTDVFQIDEIRTNSRGQKAKYTGDGQWQLIQ